MIHAYDHIIIGGGAAGFFGAIHAAQPGKRTAILEKSEKLLSKVRVSGGGRCNVTHACFDNRELVKFYPRGGKELQGAFSRFSVNDTIRFFESRGVKLKVEDDGRMFPVTDDSASIVNCLRREADDKRVEVLTGKDVVKIEKRDGLFLLHLKSGEIFSSPKLLLATGGFSKSAAYDFIRETGHKIVEPVPSLFTFNMPGNPVTKLMGVAAPAKVKIEGTKIETEGPLLITHWGMSGPAILKASSWGARELAEKNYQFTALVQWLPGEANLEKVKEALQQTRNSESARTVFVSSAFNLPKRLWQFLVGKSGIGETTRWADLSKKQMQALAENLFADRYEVRGKTTFKEEFVTCGGVALEEVDFKTMQSKKCPGLFFAGEVLNIDALTGGFNFQAAWTTSSIAGHSMREDE